MMRTVLYAGWIAEAREAAGIGTGPEPERGN
jgi:hypothetical protein